MHVRLINLYLLEENVDIYLSQVYLRIGEYNERDWNWNTALRFPIPKCYPLHYLHI